jgi:hypothetical protein
MKGRAGRALTVGRRHPNRFYRRTTRRLASRAALLGIVLTVAYGLTYFSEIAQIPPEREVWLLLGAAGAFGVTLLAWLGGRMAYFQPRRDHLRLVTPFLQLRIAYRRISSVHPALLRQLFPPEGGSWSQRAYLEPFYQETVVVIELDSYPLSRAALRLFLPPVMFSPHGAGLVILVPDWMGFSTELDSFLGSWRQMQSRPPGASRIR